MSCIFTSTHDLNAQFPAVAARKLGLDTVPLLCAEGDRCPGGDALGDPRPGALLRARRSHPGSCLSRGSAGTALRFEGGPVTVRVRTVWVREATPDDTGAIVSVTVAGWRTAYRDIVAPEKLADLPIDRWRHEIGVGLRRPVDDAFTYVAEIDGAFAGYCCVAAPARDSDLAPDVAELVGDVRGSRTLAGRCRRSIDARRRWGGWRACPTPKRFCGRSRRTGAQSGFYERLGWRRRRHGEDSLPLGRAGAVRYARPIEDAGRPATIGARR